jgi:hypothetical protein
VRSHGHGGGERIRVLGLDGLVLQPAADLVEAGVAEPLLGLLGRGEVPHHLEPLEVIDELRPRGHGDDRLGVLGDVARPTALGDQLAAGPQGLVQAAEELVVVEDPVEGRRREDRIDRLVEPELREVDDHVVRSVPEGLTGNGDHGL